MTALPQVRRLLKVLAGWLAWCAVMLAAVRILETCCVVRNVLVVKQCKTQLLRSRCLNARLLTLAAIASVLQPLVHVYK